MKFDMEMIQKIYCSKEEQKEFKTMQKNKQPLPNDVKADDSGYFRFVDTALTQEELSQLYVYRQLSYLKSIRNSMYFFVTLTIISLIVLLVLGVR